MELVKPAIGLLFWMCVSFGIVLFILGKFAWKPIMASLKEREDTIEEALSAAQRAKDEMVKLQAVGLAQEKQFGDILLKKAKSFDTVFDEKGELKQIDQEYQ